MKTENSLGLTEPVPAGRKEKHIADVFNQIRIFRRKFPQDCLNLAWIQLSEKALLQRKTADIFVDGIYA